MRRTPAILASGALVAALALPAAPVAADPSGTCPDGFVPISAALTNGNQDHNGDGIVCGKFAGGGFVGGPDPRTPPVPGAVPHQIDGEWWWIVDNTII